MVTAPIPALKREAAATQKASSLPLQLFAYWHLLSLDAPTVAVVWCCAFAQAVGATIHFASAVMLGVATWLLYVADRLLDGAQPSHASLLQERHYFHTRHRSAFLSATVPAVCLLLWLFVVHTDHLLRLDYLLLSGCAGTYLLWVHLPAKRLRLFPKEAAVAIIFAAGCIIPTWTSRTTARLWLVVVGMLFVLLCWLNCYAIETWEKSAHTPHPFTHAARSRVRFHCQLLSAISLPLALIGGGSRHAGFAALCVSIAASALLLAKLNAAKRRIPAVQLRAAADAALLTPAIFLLIHLLFRLL